VNISDQWERNRQPLETYSSEVRDWLHAHFFGAVTHFVSWHDVQLCLASAFEFFLTRQLV
jgi:hypothetical protein